MKLKFKHQGYQQDATQAVVDCFAGQTQGVRKEIIDRTGIFPHEIFANKPSILHEP